MHTVKLTKITLKNFIGIKTGLGKSELTVNLSKLLDKDIICILGDNGTGKTTLSSVMHPLPGTTDKRNKFIIEDKEGVKKVYYDRSDGCKYICKLVYSPSKTGHTTKGFITKINKDGEEVELNPNGNISSYKDAIFEELGVNDAILKLANQNDVCKGHVDMTSTERKTNMSTFLPEDIYSNYFAVVDKTYREMKTRINVLVEAIGKMHDDDTIRINLEKVTKDINSLVEKRDKCIGKIKEFETRINIYKSNGIFDKEKDLSRNIRDNNKSIDKVKNKLDSIREDSAVSNILGPSVDLSSLNNLIELYETKMQSVDMSIMVLDSTDLKSTRNSLSEEINKKKEILKDIETDYSLSELKDMLKTYKKRFNELDKLISKLDTSLTKNDFMTGYNIVATVRRAIDAICEEDSHTIDYIVTSDNISEELSKLDSYYNQLETLREDKDFLLNNISNLNKDSGLKDILDKRPKNCIIDDCPFIKNAQKWTLIEKEIIKYKSEMDKVNNNIDKLNDIIHDLEYKSHIYDKIKNLWSYIETNMNLISKLPYSDKYNTFEAILKAIKKRGTNLSECDNFDQFIEIFEFRDEFNELKYKKIPTVENEIHIFETQGKLIDNSRDELKSLNERLENINNQINENAVKLNKLNDTKDELEYIIDRLKRYRDKKFEYDDLYNELVKNVNDLKLVNKDISEYENYKIKLKERKDKLDDINDALNPLTRERELYKMEQLKIADHKQELAAIEEDMYKCEIIRSSLSIKDDGIPVGALEYFMDTVRINANALLSGAFNGALYLEEFIINAKDFIIPYKKNGDRGIDVSFASSSERSFISLCLTLAIMEEIISGYGIAILDEIDRGFSSTSKYKFIEILGSQIKRTGISQVFMVTHNSAFYEGYNIGYILFPGSDISKVDDSDCVKIERS